MSDASLQPILALLGHPVAGNPTQYMVQKAFRQLDLDWRYLTLDVTAEDLGDAVRGMRAMGFRGGNCADPHKQAVIPHLDRTSRAAELAGVVNLVWRAEEGLVGENTEGQALVDALAGKIDLADKHIVLFGAGRLARAAAVNLALGGVAEIAIVNRTAAHADELVGLLQGELEIAATAVSWEQAYHVPPETHVVVHATSMADGNPEARPALDVDSLTDQMIVVDAAFNPPDTWLVGEARQRGCTVLDGLEVFIRQIIIDLDIWTGVQPDAVLMREAVEEFLEL